MNVGNCVYIVLFAKVGNSVYNVLLTKVGNSVYNVHWLGESRFIMFTVLLVKVGNSVWPQTSTAPGFKPQIELYV